MDEESLNKPDVLEVAEDKPSLRVSPDPAPGTEAAETLHELLTTVSVEAPPAQCHSKPPDAIESGCRPLKNMYIRARNWSIVYLLILWLGSMAVGMRTQEDFVRSYIETPLSSMKDMHSCGPLWGLNFGTGEVRFVSSEPIKLRDQDKYTQTEAGQYFSEIRPSLIQNFPWDKAQLQQTYVWECWTRVAPNGSHSILLHNKRTNVYYMCEVAS